MRCVLFTLLILSATNLLASATKRCAAGEPSRHVIVHMLDPRPGTRTDHTLVTKDGKAAADIIATRILSASEAKTLYDLLKVELADDDNIPFCGHYPAYAVQVARENAKPATVTLCGVCGTWERDGELKALHGKKSLELLEKLLPLPDVFSFDDKKPSEVLSAFHDSPQVPFYRLTKHEAASPSNEP